MTRRFQFGIARALLFGAVTLLLAFGRLSQLATSVPGNPGDAYLIMALLEWGGQRATHFFDGYWAGPMYAGGTAVMGYTDTFLPLTVPFAIIEGLTGSRVVAFNTLYLASWVLCAEATYRLGLHLLRSRPVAILVAVAFTFSTIRLEQSGHFQLAWAGFIPLSVLFLLKLRHRPTIRAGLLLAGCVVVQLLTSAYYGVALLTFVSAVLVLDAIVAVRRRVWRPWVRPLAAYAAAVLVVMLPIQYAYSVAARGAPSRGGWRPSEPELKLGDLRSPAPSASLPRRLWVFDTGTAHRSSENFAYLGAFVLLLVPTAVAILIWRRYRGRPTQVSSDWSILIALGAVAALVAFGRSPVLGVKLPIYDVFAKVVPGLGSMIALVRLVVFAQLALTLVAGWAVVTLFARVRRPGRLVVSTLALTSVVAEARQTIPLIDVVEPADESVYAVMKDLDPGVVVELPMASRHLGGVYAYIEATRMVLGTDDDLRSVNGYSGYAPTGYQDTVLALNTFPSADSLVEIRRLGVDYVVVHTAPIRTGWDATRDAKLNDTGYTYFRPDHLRALDALLDPRLYTARIHAVDGFVLVLADPET